MEKNFEEIIEYLKKLGEYTLPSYNDLPKIPLYMEQVVNYISETLSPLFKENTNGIISPHRVNNYVKAKILVPPKDKKYDVNHIGYLIFISLLKTSSSLRNLALLLKLTINMEMEIKKNFILDLKKFKTIKWQRFYQEL